MPVRSQRFRSRRRSATNGEKRSIATNRCSDLRRSWGGIFAALFYCLAVRSPRSFFISSSRVAPASSLTAVSDRFRLCRFGHHRFGLYRFGFQGLYFSRFDFRGFDVRWLGGFWLKLLDRGLFHFRLQHPVEIGNEIFCADGLLVWRFRFGNGHLRFRCRLRRPSVQLTLPVALASGWSWPDEEQRERSLDQVQAQAELHPQALLPE